MQEMGPPPTIESYKSTWTKAIFLLLVLCSSEGTHVAENVGYLLTSSLMTVRVRVRVWWAPIIQSINWAFFFWLNRLMGRAIFEWWGRVLIPFPLGSKRMEDKEVNNFLNNAIY